MKGRLSFRAGPPRGTPCGFLYRAASARQKKERHPARTPGVEGWVPHFLLLVEERPFRAAKSGPKTLCHLE
jgi:hypothetical protein